MKTIYVVMARLGDANVNPGRVVPVVLFNNLSKALDKRNLMNELESPDYVKGSAYCIPLALERV